MPDLYVYDGTFEGLLSVLQLLREEGEEADDIARGEEGLQERLFAHTRRVATDARRVAEISGDICRDISRRAFRHIFLAFLSGAPGAEYHIYRYLALGWVADEKVDAHLHDEHVHAVHRLSRATAREAHRMRGFLRFRELAGGPYYAPMQPECDVLCLVSRHFLGRMGNQEWMIHDLGRGRAALCRNGELSYVELREFDPHLARQEERCQELWRDYFKTIAIAERHNPRLQRSCMPKKYWNILIEI